MNATSAYDTIIIGGGPGGSTAGAFLAKAGQRVLVLEKENFPRFHIGESLLPFGNDVLKQTGAWPKIEAAGFQRKYGAEFLVGNGSRFQRFWFARGLVPGYGQTFQVERAKFDEVLLDHAATCGCEVRQGCEARTVVRDGDGWRVTVDDSGGPRSVVASETSRTRQSASLQSVTVDDSGGPRSVVASETLRTRQSASLQSTTQEARARWLIDASGRDTFLGRVLGLPKLPVNIPKRIALYAHFTGVYRNPGDAEGHITIVRLRDGWFWLIPLAGGKTSVGMVRMLDDLKRFGGTVEDWFARTVAGSREVARRMEKAQRVSEFYRTSDYSYRYAQLAADRALLVGDAGGFIDPIFSSGVHIATTSARMAAELILRADAKLRALTGREQRRYTRDVHRFMNIYRDMILMYYDNRAFEVFMNPRNFFRMVQTVNTILAGNMHRSFDMWWRVKIFQLACAIHRRVPIVPRLDYSET
jgi:flavin-dependent dehydrogenase